MSCLICNDRKIQIKMSCCQKNTNNDYGLCKPCFKKLDKCPLCRANRRLSRKDLYNISEDYYYELYLAANIYLTQVKFATQEFLKEPRDVRHLFDFFSLPDNINVIQMPFLL